MFRRSYEDQITDEVGRKFYNNVFNYHPTSSFDSVSVRKLENRVFIRLQPWSDQAIVSKLNGGIGNRILSFSSLDPTFLKGTTNTVWNSAFVYAGVEGQLKDYIHWDATGNYVFLGDQMNDLSVKANARLDFHPFRRAKRVRSPLTFISTHRWKSLSTTTSTTILTTTGGTMTSGRSLPPDSKAA